MDGELKDTASSPIKTSMSRDMELDRSSCKRLNMDGGIETLGITTPSAAHREVLLLTDGKGDGEPESPTNSSGSKRAKRDGETSNSEKILAGSQEERRQSQ